MRSTLLYLTALLVAAFGLLAGPSASWAAYGDWVTNIGTLNQPAKVAVDSANGDVYVTDAGNKCVKKYDKNGTLDAGFTLNVSYVPVGIAVTATNIFVGDDTNDGVMIYNKSGAPADLPNTGTSHKLGGPNCYKIKMPNTITVGPSGHIFVVDGDQDKVRVFRADGSLTYTFGTSGTSTSGTPTAQTIYLYYPSGITMANTSVAGTSTTQYFYLGDQGNNRVQKLYYVYNNTNNAMTTNPTYYSTAGIVGTGVGDNYGKFLRIADVAWDPSYDGGRLAVTDSLQMVSQLFYSSTNASMSAAFNYNAGVLGRMNVPTGSAYDVTNQKFYVANNQAGNIAVFDANNGVRPTVTITAPASATTPCTATYNVLYNGTSQAASVTAKVYYFNSSTPNNKMLFATQTLSVSGGNYSNSSSPAVLNLVGTYPNFMMAGTYGIYIEVTDTNNAVITATASGTIGITLVAGRTNYTCSMQAAWDPGNTGTVDTDGDGVSDIDEIDGTFNTAYGSAMTDPTKKDTDGDGLDDGVEMKVRTLAQNTTITLTGGLLAAATNPNSKDTDNGGVSDAVEIAKATDPISGSDDLVVASSAQDLVCDYFLDQSGDLQSSTMTFKNIGTSNAVLDFTFYNLNGTVQMKVPAAYILVANQCVRLNPFQTYGVTEGSLEVRSTSTRIAGDLYRYNHNYINTAYLDMGGGQNMWWPSGKSTDLRSIVFNDNDGANYRFKTWINVKNWSDSTANVTINFYRNTDGALVSTGVIPLAGHQATNLKPRDYVPTWTGGSVQVTSDIAVTASQYTARFNGADSLTYDWSFLYPYSKTASTESYGTIWTDSYNSNFRFIGYVYCYNPNDTPMDATFTFYDLSGNVVATKVFSAATSNAIGAKMKVNVRPSTVGVPAAITGGTYKITSSAPHVSAANVQRYNPASQSLPDGSKLFDWAYYAPSDQDTGLTSMYVPLYLDFTTTEPVDRFIGFMYIYNPGPNTLNYTVTYYNKDGSFNKTTTSRSLNANGRVNIRPNTNDAGPKEGSAVINGDNPFLGFVVEQPWNVDVTSTIDNAFTKPFWR